MLFNRRSLGYLAALAACASKTVALLTTGVMFPLYIYPGDDCANWDAVNTGIATYPNVRFYIVVSPGIGPGPNATQPDTTYQTCIALLRSKGVATHNVKILGYVDTDYGNRASLDVITDINTYAQWGSSYRPDGIFFDQASSSADRLSTYTTYSNQVHTKIPGQYIVLNPGVKPETNDYYGIANQIVTFENYYSSFNINDVVIDPTSTPGQKQSILIHTGPNPTDSNVVAQLKGKNIASIFMTDFPKDDAYTNMPSDYANFVYLVNSIQAVVGLHPSP